MSRTGLDVVDIGGETETRPHALVFVHGAWHAGWCWEQHFLSFFVEHGFRVVAPSLRGHGNSPSDKPLRMYSIADYVRDVAGVVAALPTPPVLIGHSLGGFVVQKYLEKSDAPAAVLMASTPPRGQLGSLLRSIRRHPWRSTKFAITGDPADLCGTPAGARETFFSDDAPDEVVEAFMGQVQPDSTRAVMFDTVLGDLVRTHRVRTPLLVVGGERDRLYTPADVRRTAAAYATEPVLFPGMGHELMLEPDWRIVADRIELWLALRGF